MSASLSPTYTPLLRLYQDWLKSERGLEFADYAALWQWSVTELNAFWLSMWDSQGLESPDTPHLALTNAQMPNTTWFPDVRVNYAQRVFSHAARADAAGMPAIIAQNEQGEVRQYTWTQLQHDVAALACTLREQGVGRGDCIAAYLPNIPEAVVAFLACASLGAIWSICAPDMGSRAVLDRFQQIRPKVLIGVDGVYYVGKGQDRSEALQTLISELPSLSAAIVLRSAYAAQQIPARFEWNAVIARQDQAVAQFRPEWLPFDHPLWVVYSSGTTGLPKALVHGHGGVMLMTTVSHMHNDVGCSYHPNNWGERFHWYSSTGWIMWNVQVGALLGGTTICLFDGSPTGSRTQPDHGVLWRFAATHRVTWFGAGAAFYAGCIKAGVDLTACGDLQSIRALGSTGSPLPDDVQQAISDQFAQIGTPDMWWCNISGGTDVVGAFMGGNRELETPAGRLQCRQLGCAIEAWDEQGQSVINAVGELVCTQPLPAMPLYLWGDTDGQRYVSSYFDVYPNIWRHGDWLQVMEDGSCVIYGRSDATINRHGLRMGTSELYAAVEALPFVQDSLVIDLEYLGKESRMMMFVVLSDGTALDQAAVAAIRDAIKTAVSPRFVPDDLIQAPSIPRTLSGKKQEIPIRKLFLGHPLEKVMNLDAVADAQGVWWYVEQAQAYLAKTAQHA